MVSRPDRKLITINQQRYESERTADWVDAVRRGVCPFCAEGPFVMVAQHVAHMHGVTTRELRRMLGLSRRQSLVDPTYSALMSSIAKEKHAKGVLHGIPPAARATGTPLGGLAKARNDRMRRSGDAS